MLEGISSDFFLPNLYGGDVGKTFFGIFGILLCVAVIVIIYHFVYVVKYETQFTEMDDKIVKAKEEIIRMFFTPQMQTPTPTMRK